jgi:hypothetical protein
MDSAPEQVRHLFYMVNILAFVNQPPWHIKANRLNLMSWLSGHFSAVAAMTLAYLAIGQICC